MEMKKLWLCCLFTASGLMTMAQFSDHRYELGLDGGIFIYQGDLAPSVAGSWKTIRPGIILNGSKNINPSWSIRAQLLRASLAGNDALYTSQEYRQFRNFKFHTPLTEFQVHLLWKPRFNYRDPNYLPRWQPYAFAGLSIAKLNVFRDASNINTTYFAEGSSIYTGLAQDFIHPTPKLLPAIPIGVGLRYALNDRWGMKLESNYRFLFTDYLDGFSKSAGSNRKDSYHSATVGLFLMLGKGRYTDCPRAQ